MTRRILFLAILHQAMFAASGAVTISLRGKPQTLARFSAAGGASAPATVLFLCGDGGWRGASVNAARTISAWGYEVFGFDSRKYLESFSQNAPALTLGQMASDIRLVAQEIGTIAGKPAILIGWSQGAGMAIAAASGLQARHPVRGVLTLGTPLSAVLGWDWKASLAAIARREPDQPAFSLRPLVPHLAPTPVWMIHGTADEYTKPETVQALFHLASEPKRIEIIGGANHRFDGHQEELFRSIRAGLDWIAMQ